MGVFTGPRNSTPPSEERGNREGDRESPNRSRGPAGRPPGTSRRGESPALPPELGRSVGRAEHREPMVGTWLPLTRGVRSSDGRSWPHDRAAQTRTRARLSFRRCVR